VDGYLFDTNTLSALLDPSHSRHTDATTAVASLDPAAPKFVSVVALAELQFGKLLIEAFAGSTPAALSSIISQRRPMRASKSPGTRRRSTASSRPIWRSFTSPKLSGGIDRAGWKTGLIKRPASGSRSMKTTFGCALRLASAIWSCSPRTGKWTGLREPIRWCGYP
jgi:hypothetical protein